MANPDASEQFIISGGAGRHSSECMGRSEGRPKIEANMQLLESGSNGQNVERQQGGRQDVHDENGCPQKPE
jgi:hypothetical protein